MLYNSDNLDVVENGIAALTEFVKRLSQAAIIELIPTLRRAVSDLNRIAKNKTAISGLTNPKVC